MPENAQLYVDLGNGATGPFTANQIVAMIRGGMVRCDTLVSGGHDQWVRAVDIDAFNALFAPQESAPAVQAQARHASNQTLVKWLVFLGAAAVIGLILNAALSSKSSIKTSTTPTVDTQAQEVEKRTIIDDLAEKRTVSEALTLMSQHFEDAVNNNSPSSFAFAAWASADLTWVDLNSVAVTTHAKTMKDSGAERGKRICVAGFVSEISADRSINPPIYTGGIVGESGEVTRFVAVHSTGEIVARSRVKFCGIVVGRVSYDNASGGTTHAVALVGMFDLEENRKFVSH